MLRTSDANGSGAESQGEVGTIFATSLRNGALAAADKAYLDEVVVARTGLDQASADKRVADVFGNAQHAAETTRKALSRTLLRMFIALLIGAFCASFAGTIGGKQRDNVVLL